MNPDLLRGIRTAADISNQFPSDRRVLVSGIVYDRMSVNEAHFLECRSEGEAIAWAVKNNWHVIHSDKGNWAIAPLKSINRYPHTMGHAPQPQSQPVSRIQNLDTGQTDHFNLSLGSYRQ